MLLKSLPPRAPWFLFLVLALSTSEGVGHAWAEEPVEPEQPVADARADGGAGAEDAGADARAVGADKRTFVIPVEGPIDAGLLGFVERKFAHARDRGAEVIVLEIDSPGGRLDSTFEMVELIRGADEVETVAFVRGTALSGAAMIALACERIEMHPEAQLGDVGVIIGGLFSPFQYVEEKERSPVVAKIRTIAEANGRPAALAEAMVDKDITVYAATHREDGRETYFTDKEWESLRDTEEWQRGPPVFEARTSNFLTVNGTRAVELGLAEATSRSLDDTLERVASAGPVTVLSWTWVDSTILWLNSNFAAGVLILVGLIALAVELSSPGLGIGGLVSLLCFSLFFWSRFLGGTAGWLEVVLFGLSLIFIAAEVFVFPGFGVAGVSGLALMIISLVMASRRVFLPQTVPDWSDFGATVVTIGLAMAGVVIVGLFATHYFTNLPLFNRLVLEPPQPQTDAAGAAVAGGKKTDDLPAWQRIGIGDLGRALSPLRPSGKGQFAEDIVDVATEGEYIESGAAIRVIKKRGTRLIVRLA